MKFLRIVFLLLSSSVIAKPVVNVYVWSDELPTEVVHQFEEETGIQVNYSTYDSNETLFAKLKASRHMQYDVVQPSSYYVSRMRRQGMLQRLNPALLPNRRHLDPFFRGRAYDPQDAFSVPFIWSLTGIFVNQSFHDPQSISHWQQLWQAQFHRQLMLIDDMREVFSIALLTQGKSPNTESIDDIRNAYEKLTTLMPNVKLFATDNLEAIGIDEDASIGMAFNGDIAKMRRENKSIQMVLPQEGFVIWADCYAIPRGAPHAANAHKFINFLMRPDIAAKAARLYGYPIANRSARRLLPPAIRNDQILYPPDKVLKRAIFQTDVEDAALQAYARFWQRLKINA